MYTYTDFAIEICGFDQRLTVTDTLLYHQNEAPHDYNILQVAITSSCLPVGRKVIFSRSCTLYGVPMFT